MAEYGYSGAAGGFGRTLGSMLWSDPDDRPPERLRAAQAHLQRASWVLAVAVFLLTLVIAGK